MKAAYIDALGKSLLNDVNSTLTAGFEEIRTENYVNGELVSMNVVRKYLTPRRRRILERLKRTLEKAQNGQGKQDTTGHS